MQLSDRSIRRLLGIGYLGIDPRPADRAFQPSTVDLTLGALKTTDNEPLTLPYVLRPNEFILGGTIEELVVPRDIACQIKGKSTWARQGLMVECAGFIDPGFNGVPTLEIKNLHHSKDIVLRYEDYIAQIAFWQTDFPCSRPYGDPELGSHYQGQRGVTPARVY